jgi:prophage regulatory protein
MSGDVEKERLVNNQSNKPPMILRQKQVQMRTGLSRSTIYLRIAEGNFPTPISLGARAVGWLDTEVDAWLARQVDLSRNSLVDRPQVRLVR